MMHNLPHSRNVGSWGSNENTLILPKLVAARGVEESRGRLATRAHLIAMSAAELFPWGRVTHRMHAQRSV